MRYLNCMIALAIVLIGCSKEDHTVGQKLRAFDMDSNIPKTRQVLIPVAEHFGFPVGYPDMLGYHDANPFMHINSWGGQHLGADLNKDGNGDNDLGDTIYAIGNGKVAYVGHPLFTIMHRTTDEKYPFIVSSYYHCKVIFVEKGEIVKAGQPVALVGKEYTDLAHLHFEIFTDTAQVAGFYGENDGSFLDPVEFIRMHR